MGVNEYLVVLELSGFGSKFGRVSDKCRLGNRVIVKTGENRSTWNRRYWVMIMNVNAVISWPQLTIYS